MQTSHTLSSTRRSAIRHAALAALLTLALCAPALSQTLPPIAKTADLSGPRFGLTLLSDGVVKKLEERDINVGPHISQFGWQFEKQFYTRDSGVTMVTEWVALVGGLEQSVVLPSLSWMVGVRTRDGAEFGIGPNVTPAGTALVLATGHDLPHRRSEHPGQCRGGALEVRVARERAHRLQPATPMTKKGYDPFFAILRKGVVPLFAKEHYIHLCAWRSSAGRESERARSSGSSATCITTDRTARARKACGIRGCSKTSRTGAIRSASRRISARSTTPTTVTPRTTTGPAR